MDVFILFNIKALVYVVDRKTISVSSCQDECSWLNGCDMRMGVNHRGVKIYVKHEYCVFKINQGY